MDHPVVTAPIRTHPSNAPHIVAPASTGRTSTASFTLQPHQPQGSETLLRAQSYPPQPPPNPARGPQQDPAQQPAREKPPHADAAAGARGAEELEMARGQLIGCGPASGNRPGNRRSSVTPPEPMRPHFQSMPRSTVPSASHASDARGGPTHLDRRESPAEHQLQGHDSDPSGPAVHSAPSIPDHTTVPTVRAFVRPILRSVMLTWLSYGTGPPPRLRPTAE